jgi:hypothetical protein
MKSPISTLEGLHRAYRHWAGEPFSVSTFRSEHDSTLTTLDVICYRSSNEDNLRPENEFTFLATVGLGLHNIGDNPRAELIWRVSGRRSWTEIKALSECLARIAVLPLYRPNVSFTPGSVIYGLSFPVFEGKDCLLVIHWGAQRPEYLPGVKPSVLLLWIKPLYNSETSIVRRVGSCGSLTLFRKEGIDLDDPRRSPARF